MGRYANKLFEVFIKYISLLSFIVILKEVILFSNRKKTYCR